MISIRLRIQEYKASIGETERSLLTATDMPLQGKEALSIRRSQQGLEKV